MCVCVCVCVCLGYVCVREGMNGPSGRRFPWLEGGCMRTFALSRLRRCALSGSSTLGLSEVNVRSASLCSAFALRSDCDEDGGSARVTVRKRDGEQQVSSGKGNDGGQRQRTSFWRVSSSIAAFSRNAVADDSVS